MDIETTMRYEDIIPEYYFAFLMVSVTEYSAKRVSPGYIFFVIRIFSINYGIFISFYFKFKFGY